MQFVVVLTIVCVCLHIYSIDIVLRVIAFLKAEASFNVAKRAVSL